MRSLARQFVEIKDGEEVWKMARNKYSIAEVWRVIRPRKEKVLWHRLLWGTLTIPKHSVIAWMAILNRLPTLDRLISWGMEINGICYLCQRELETRDHIFFECRYSKEVWEMILSNCGLNKMTRSWNEELQWVVRKIKGKQLINAILSVAWRAFIYHVWRERNGRMHGQPMRSSEQIFEHIKEEVRIKITGRKINVATVNRQLCDSWGLLGIC